MRALVVIWVATIAGCPYAGPKVGDGDGSTDAPPDDRPWWDGAWTHRGGLVVTTGPRRPDKGYAGYTVRLAGLDTAALIATSQLQAGCDDLRLLIWDGTTWTERSRDLIACGSAAAELRFSLPIDLGDSAMWRDAALYWGNPAAGPPPPIGTGAVYLWWDDASIDRSADYVHGRMDPWLVTGHDDSLTWGGGGYRYATGDNSQSSYRRPVDERDVLVEAEWFHTGCWINNMQSGVCARGVIASGTGASETADHYYCTSRAQNPTCNDVDQAISDGDIVETDNEVIAIYGGVDPPPIVPSQWRKQALAVFGADPSELRFWDADASWPGPGFPPAATLQASGADADDYDQRGFAGVMTAQDAGGLRAIVIRRYVEPEPTVVRE